MMSFFKKMFSRPKGASQKDVPQKGVPVVEQSYHVIMAQSRNASLYRDFLVPDTSNGRFESLTLHLFFVLNRLHKNDDICGAFAQDLIDYLVVNLDHTLRDVGVSDTRIKKRIVAMLKLFYGRLKVYDESAERMALGQSDQQFLDFLGRTVFDKSEVSIVEKKRLEVYFQKVVELLKTKDLAYFLDGKLNADDYQKCLDEALLDEVL